METKAFDGIQIQTIKNVQLLIQNDFSATGNQTLNNPIFIEIMKKKMMDLAIDIFAKTKYANSIFPDCMKQYWMRTGVIKTAVAQVFDLLAMYQVALTVLKVNDNQYTDQIEHLKKQAGLLKGWLSSDRNTYKERDWFDLSIQ